jgi:hypothetical protein
MGVSPIDVVQLKLFDLWDGPVTFKSDHERAWAEYWIYTTTQFNYAASEFASKLRKVNENYTAKANFTFEKI